MSHFTVLKTKMTDLESLLTALSDCGLGQVEVHEHGTNLYGYQGDVRGETAEVIIRRKFVGELSNDIGFKRLTDGTFEAIVSEYDSTQYGHAWVQSITRRYAYHATKKKLSEQGFSVVTEETSATSRLHLVLRRTV